MSEDWTFFWDSLLPFIKHTCHFTLTSAKLNLQIPDFYHSNHFPQSHPGWHLMCCRQSQVLVLWGPDGHEARWKPLEHKAWGTVAMAGVWEGGSEGRGYGRQLDFTCFLAFLCRSVAVQKSFSGSAIHSPLGQTYHLVLWWDSVY